MERSSDPDSTIYTKAEAQAQAERNIAALSSMAGGADDIRYHFMEALDGNLPPRAMLNRIKKAAAKISEVVTPMSACKSGCSFCCHISVGICESEAKAISKATGRKIADVLPDPSLILREKWHNTPCPFLKLGKCSIYEDRPISCRLNFNMADTPEQCDTRIPSSESYVMFLNLKPLEQGFLGAFLNEKWADIRDFFPPA